MKKTLIYILLIIVTSISIAGATAYADEELGGDSNNPNKSNSDTNSGSDLSKDSDKVNDENTYYRQIIPKPDLLPGPDEAEQEGEGAEDILINRILPNYAVGLVGFVGMLSVLMLLIAGVRFSMAYGNDESIQKAKDQAIYALIGLVIAILSYTIVRIVTNVKYEENQTTTSYEITTIV